VLIWFRPLSRYPSLQQGLVLIFGIRSVPQETSFIMFSQELPNVVGRLRCFVPVFRDILTTMIGITPSQTRPLSGRDHGIRAIDAIERQDLKAAASIVEDMVSDSDYCRVKCRLYGTFGVSCSSVTSNVLLRLL
jgi:hypothetical protein